MRIGIGFDIHPLVPKRDLVLGGIKIPHAFGLLGHSDADIIIHALCDALLGALGEGDIGERFPDTDVRYKNISSLFFLQSIYELMREKEYQVENIDMTVLANLAKISPYKARIQKNLAKELHIEENQVNVKASTTNGLPFCFGEKEGIAVYCVVLLNGL